MIPPIHYHSVLVAAILAFVLGAVWYSPALFASAWMRAHGYGDEQIARMRARAAKSYASSFVCFVVMAVAMDALIGRVQPVGVLGGLKLGALVGVGFAAMASLIANLYSDKPLAAWAIDAGYQVGYVVLMAVVLTVWR